MSIRKCNVNDDKLITISLQIVGGELLLFKVLIVVA
jgi:hypothetical protein